MIQVEQTPNPDSLKFLSQRILSKVGTEEFKKVNLDRINIPFIKEVLNFSGVDPKIKDVKIDGYDILK